MSLSHKKRESSRPFPVVLFFPRVLVMLFFFLSLSFSFFLFLDLSLRQYPEKKDGEQMVNR